MSHRPTKPRIRKKPQGHVQTPPVRSEINVTPLVDVVLVLLIIFMVVTPMLTSGVSVDLPQTNNHAKKNDTGEQVMVSIDHDGKVYIDTDLVAEDDLVGRVQRELAQKGKTHQVHVKGDRRLSYGQVRKVLERINEAGAPQVALGTEELKEAN